MGVPREPATQPDALITAQLAPTRRVVAPGTPGRFSLCVDNHDRRARAIQLQLGGPMSRYSKPRLCTIDVLPGEQREVVIEVSPRATAPEGGHEYELTVTATDLGDGTFLDRSSATLAVERRPALKGRPVGVQHTVDNELIPLRFVAYNAGNVELVVEVYAVGAYWWVRDTLRQRAEDRAQSVRTGISSILTEPVAVEQVRPGEHWTVELPAVAPRYPFGFGPRRWMIPVGVQAQGWSPECVFVQLEQQPRTVLPRQSGYLAAGVLLALVVLAGLLIWLAG